MVPERGAPNSVSPRWGANSAPQLPELDLRGPTSKGEEERNGLEGWKGRIEEGVEKDGGKGEEWEREGKGRGEGRGRRSVPQNKNLRLRLLARSLVVFRVCNNDYMNISLWYSLPGAKKHHV